MHIALGITNSDMENMYNKDSIRYAKVLGFKESSKELLTEIKKKADLKLVTKLADAVRDGADKMLLQNIEADRLYRMVAMNKYGVDLKNPFSEEIVIV